MDIYSILASKPHNPHYLNRYITFIRQCQLQNLMNDTCLEKHHICPKAKDMFPEYMSLSENKWNRADLTLRQHFLSHIMLWKAFPHSRSQMYAAYAMKNKNGMKLNSRIYCILKEDFRKNRSNESLLEQRNRIDNGTHHFIGKTNPTYNMSVETKSKISNTMKKKVQAGKCPLQGKGKVSVRDKNGNVFRTDINNPKIKSGELTFLTVGRITVKDKNENTFSVFKDDSRYLSGELVGIMKGRNKKKI